MGGDQARFLEQAFERDKRLGLGLLLLQQIIRSFSQVQGVRVGKQPGDLQAAA